MITFDLELPDTCLLYTDNDLFAGETVQLRPGNPRTHARVISGAGLEVWLYEVRQPYRVTHALLQDIFHLAIALQFEGPAFHNGIALQPGSSLVSVPRQEVEQLIRPGLILELVADRARAKERGWSIENGIVFGLPPWSLRPLARLASNVYGSPACTEISTSRASTTAEKELLIFLQNMLDAGISVSVHSNAADLGGRDDRRIVANVTELIADQDDDEAFSVAFLARNAEISERTLYRAFSRHLGVSPYRYILTWRLNRVRRLLMAAPDDLNAVTRAATQAGFAHLSDMGRHYRRTFGETPSETLARSRKKRVCLAVPMGG